MTNVRRASRSRRSSSVVGILHRRFLFKPQRSTTISIVIGLLTNIPLVKIKNKMRDKKDDWSESVEWHTEELRWKYRDYKKKQQQKKEPAPERDPNVPPTASPTDMARYEHHMRFARREMRRCTRNPNWKGVHDPQTPTGHTDISGQPWCPGRGNYDIFRDLKKSNPLRSHPAWLPAGAPPLQEWNKDEYLIPNPARRELEGK